MNFRTAHSLEHIKNEKLGDMDTVVDTLLNCSLRRRPSDLLPRGRTSLVVVRTDSCIEDSRRRHIVFLRLINSIPNSLEISL